MTSAGRADCRAMATAMIAAVGGVLLHALGEAPRDRASCMRDSPELLMALVGEDPAATV